MKALSLPLFKEDTQQLEKGEGLGRKTLSLPLFNADGNSMLMAIQGDTSGPTRHGLLDETTPGQIGCGLGMAHHYRTLGVRNKAQSHAGCSSPSQAGPRRAQRRNLHQGETNMPPESIGWPRQTPSDGVEEPNGRRKISTLIYLLYVSISLPSLRPQQWQGDRHQSEAAKSVYSFRHSLCPIPRYV